MGIPNSGKAQTCEVWTQLHLKQLLREAWGGSFQSIYLNSVSITGQDQKPRARKGILYRPSSGFPTLQTPGIVKILKYYHHFHYQITNDFSPADCLIPSEPPAPTSHTAALSQTSGICIPGCAQMHHLALLSNYEPSQGVLQQMRLQFPCSCCSY